MERKAEQRRFLTLPEAAKEWRVSVRTFKARVLPHVDAIVVSKPMAARKRRLFSIEALDAARRKMEGGAGRAA